MPPARPSEELPGPAPGAADGKLPRELDAVVYPGFALVIIGLVVWAVLAGSGYRTRIPQAGQDWHVGGDHLVEIFLTRDDQANRACASDVTVGDLACGHRADHTKIEPPADEAKVLRPYTTIRGEQFLGAGLWAAPDLRGPLPEKRFSVVCTFHITGVLRSVAQRFEANGRFLPAKTSLAAGSLVGCAFPP